MDIEEYRRLYKSGVSAPGWDAIDRAVTAIYPGQKPKHYAATRVTDCPFHCRHRAPVDMLTLLPPRRWSLRDIRIRGGGRIHRSLLSGTPMHNDNENTSRLRYRLSDNVSD